ncbi:MAG: VOC family protein [Pseudomonadota bacterium]
MKPQAILEASLYAQNLDESERFYRKTIGLDLITRSGDRHLAFRCGPTVLVVFNRRLSIQRPVMGARAPVPPHGTQGPGHVCFSVYADQIPMWIDRLTRERVRIEADFAWPTGGRSVFFRDPDQNCIELAEPRIWPPASM